MKRFLLTMCAVILAVALQAQEHMTFKGIAMGCDLTTFISKLQAQGFTQELIQDNVALLKGDFAGKSNCSIIVGATKKSKKVWKVVVNFPERSSWYSLKDDYISFKESYTKKYGKPRAYEFFSSPYDEGDGYELQAVRLEKCTYSSYYTIEEGSICLTIGSDENVEVHYEDKITSEIKEREEQTSVSEDI